MIAVVLATCNRCDQLREAVRCLLVQDADPAQFEIVVVDNNSTDGTADVVSALGRESASNLRYLFESRQGVSYARNRGITETRAPIVAFTDDDVRVSPTWIRGMLSLFESRPDIHFAGGRVLPEWGSAPPAWLGPRHWSPLALVDYGDTSVEVSATNPICLVTANAAYRREVFDRVGPFSLTVQRVGGGIGSMEDHELLLRVFRAGFRGLYDPTLVVMAPVPADRLDRSYHRRWHRGHGHFFAVLRDIDIEASARRLLDVPLHLYRAAVTDALGWTLASMRGNCEEALAREMRLQFFAGFAHQRIRHYLTGPRRKAEVSVPSPALSREPEP